MRFAFALLFLTTLSGSVRGQTTLFEYVANNTNLTALAAAALSAEPVVAETLNNTASDYTVFLPTNEALANLDPKYLEPKFQAHLTQILLYHVHPFSIRTVSTFPVGNTFLNMANKFVEQITVTKDENDNLTVTDLVKAITVSLPDATVGSEIVNGVAHHIDDVLQPTWFLLSVAGLLQNLSLNLLVNAITNLNDAGFSTVLQAASDITSQITVFAPTSEAIAGLNPAVSDFLFSGTSAGNDALDKIIRSHIIADVVPSSLVPTSGSVASIGPTPLVFGVDEEGLPLVHGSILGSLDNVANSAIVHEADEVLLPQYFVTGEFAETSLVEGLIGDYLMQQFGSEGDITLFMPTNTAFGAASQQYPEFFGAITASSTQASWALHASDLIASHIVEGIIFSPSLTDGVVSTTGSKDVTISTAGGASVDGIPIARADVVRKNSAIHFINQMIMPSWLSTTIGGQIFALSEYSTFLSAVTAVDGFIDEINSAGGAPYALTVFAPTNQAFDQLPEGFLDDLLADTDTLEMVLSYHVVPQVIASCSFTETLTVPTFLDGKLLEIVGPASLEECDRSSSFSVGEEKAASTTTNNILASNGIIHGIDAVLVPFDATPRDATQMPSAAPVLRTTGLVGAMTAVAFIL